MKQIHVPGEQAPPPASGTEPEQASMPPGVRLGTVSFVWRPWLVLVTLVLAAAAFLVFCLSIGVGDFPIALTRVVATLFGQGEQVDEFVIMDLRLPRALAGLIVGLALGVSGAITQSVARNPLASPDILGITSGAGAVAVFLVTTTGGTAAAVTGSVGLSAAALLGGLGTGLLVYFLAWRRGIDGFRLILIGISVTAMMQAITTWLLTSADIRDVARAQVWLVGSLDNRSWGEVEVAFWGTLVLLVAVALVAFPFKPMHLGDDVAAGLGVRFGRVRGVLLLCAVLLAAVGVSAAGPVPFVALVAPQVAMRLGRWPTPPLIASGLVGALLLIGSDLLARTVLPIGLPVGVVTAVIGGPFLVHLLVRANLR
ncbi:iron chelate uptake ABC transporter family permease subunit [Streptomyces californicus]|uniref:FecCD family ABC transporter permease n=2 Tax=Streptomyces TaxID=1883 RepID=UPI00067E2D08|nr:MULTISPECIES: iron chelate uptake ABC transporter family permease subunit [Streptomyces]MYW80133.1 iron chelate uptake ABC transporter family permease subunit [Streptomyces sp. SID8369]MBD3544071.1 iron chelate uptake ABC transporter family permease subunit [Streptomyces sp. JV180]MCC0576165.1 iron ABC transporter permease [Streptomyces californicus]MDW4917950.1 iron chelate uptake ABC transporter family permease subunit [Streptomyces californicus]QSS89137.1 iron chelate uptake ABC transpor